MNAAGVDFEAMRRTEFYSAHEALLLDYERALTRVDSRSGDPYATSAHFLWIGERTRQLDGAHVEFFRGIKNPIGIKVGPTLEADELLELIDVLKANPDKSAEAIKMIEDMRAKQLLAEAEEKAIITAAELRADDTEEGGK